MALTLVWDDTKHIFTAADGADFTVELRTERGPVSLVAATYNSVKCDRAPITFTAVDESKTLVVVYEATVEGALIELWEVDDNGNEQLLMGRRHNPAKSLLSMQIN